MWISQEEIQWKTESLGCVTVCQHQNTCGFEGNLLKRHRARLNEQVFEYKTVFNFATRRQRKESKLTNIGIFKLEVVGKCQVAESARLFEFAKTELRFRKDKKK